jgi:hypothetical protein
MLIGVSARGGYSEQTSCGNRVPRGVNLVAHSNEGMVVNWECVLVVHELDHLTD